MSVATEPLFDELHPPLDRAAALLEADRCLECGGPYAPAPCMVACPAGVDVAGFVAAIAADEPSAAAQTIFAENLLGATCARVCPVEVLCEGACVLATRSAKADRDRAHSSAMPPTRRSPPERRSGKRAPSNGRRVAVIGAGPAGLVCAGELAALGYDVTVFDEREEIGGLVRYAIAPYRQVREPLPEEAAALASIGVEFRLGTHVDAKRAGRDRRRRPTRSSSVPGWERTPRSRTPATSCLGSGSRCRFIERSRRARRPRRAAHVVVIGGGNTAIDVAREALRLGAEAVTLVYRRSEAEMPAYPYEVAEARAEGVRFQFLAEPGPVPRLRAAPRRSNAGDAARRPRRKRAAPPGAAAGKRVHAPARTPS